MRLTSLSLGALTLLLLVAVSVNAAPNLNTSSQASYNLSVSVSFFQSCEPVLSSSHSDVIVCPMIATMPLSLNINETLGWTVTKLNSTTANLNVTRTLPTLNGETESPAIHNSWSLNESVNLATRVATILPFIEPEMDQALQMAQTSGATSLPTGTDWSSTVSTVADTMMHHAVYTMWWVNGPLDANDTVPVLVFPTNVTGSTTLDLGGSIGTRTAWTLLYNNTQSLTHPDPLATATSSIPIARNPEFAITFNYDNTSDLLLSATADIHLGFGVETTIPCESSASTACPASNCISIVRHFGIDVHASLKLASTNLNLSQRLASTDSPPTSTGGSQSGSGSNPSTGSGTGPTSGSNPSSGSGPASGSKGPATGSGQPSSSPAQPKSSTKSASLLPWIYEILGIIAAAIIASGVWIARRRIRKTPSQIQAAPSAV
jgi:hypothetical protein